MTRIALCKPSELKADSIYLATRDSWNRRPPCFQAQHSKKPAQAQPPQNLNRNLSSPTSLDEAMLSIVKDQTILAVFKKNFP